MTLTLAQEFKEARAWFAQHKRDPPWTVDVFCDQYVGLVCIPALGSDTSYKSSSAEQCVLPKNFPKCSGRMYSFGYDFFARNFGDGSFDWGRVCRDIVKGVW